MSSRRRTSGSSTRCTRRAAAAIRCARSRPGSALPPGGGKKMAFTGMTVLKVENGLITEEIGVDDGVTALQQLGLIPQQ